MNNNHRHFKIHKPDGYLSQFQDNSTNNKKMLGLLQDFPKGTMSIGRLDEDSEGLLFLTTDGKVSNYVTSRKVEKEYYAQVDGLITDAAIELIKSGIEIGIHGKKYITKPCNARKLKVEPEFQPRYKRIRDDRHGPRSWVSITLREGKYKQVRKMTAGAGFPTLRLVRVRIGNERLEGLLAGDVLEVETFDLDEQ